VVAGSRDVVADEIHRFDQRVGVAGLRPGVVVCERLALDQVTRVKHDHSSGITRAQRIDDGRGPGETARKRPVRHVIPVGGVAVDVGGGNENEVDGVGGCRNDCRGEQQGMEHGAI
jgi:hypothetical protein